MGRMKTESLYDCYNMERMTVEKLSVLIWRYSLSYRKNRTICSAKKGLPSMINRGHSDEVLELTVSYVLDRNVSNNLDNITLS